MKYIELGEGKSAQAADDGTVSISQGQNIVYLKFIEVENLKHWLKEIK